MVHYIRVHLRPRLRVEFKRRIGRRILVRTINRRLLTAGYPSHRPARCPRLTREHRRRRRQWARRHRDWDLRHWRNHCLLWRVLLQTISQLSDLSSQAWRVYIYTYILILVYNKQRTMWFHPYWVCAVLVLSVSMWSFYYFPDRVLFIMIFIIIVVNIIAIILVSNFFMSCLHSLVGYYTREFHALQLIVLVAFGAVD